MKVFKKLKDVLFDIEEDELPIITKKEKEEIKLPKFQEENTIKEIKISKEEISERELMKSDSTFNFPLEVEEVTRSNRNFKFEDEPVRKSDPKDFSRLFNEEMKTEKSKDKFKPTPIISPVYGILDQNYSKDDIIVKTDIGVAAPDLDEVRKKAYGINSKKEISKKKTSKEEKPVKEADEALKTLDEILMAEDEKNIKKEEIKPIIDDELPDQPYSDEKDLNIENTIETDLFNLIDSMYEDRKESEE
ncbi:MAG: hypothetical protein PHX04_00785 [Bacilli bacterium]|nr:hypothetical protein [Bacilli bacterium]